MLMKNRVPLKSIPFVLLLLTLTACIGWIFYRITELGSLKNALLYLNGHEFTFEAPVFDPIKGPAASERIARFKFTNLSSTNVVVSGARPDCSCISVRSLPLKVPPYKSDWIPISYSTGNSASIRDNRTKPEDQKTVEFFVDREGSRYAQVVAFTPE